MRLCDCGCGTPIIGAPTKRFVDDAHRKRAARRGNSGHEPDTIVSGADVPAVVAGRVRSGLEDWLNDRDSLPQSLVEAARALADMVDAAPDNSPLWGRYADVLRQLGEAAQVLEVNAQVELVKLQRWMVTGCDEPAHHAFVHCGACCRDGARHCVAGEHEFSIWTDHALGGRICENCGTVDTRQSIS